MFRASLDSGNMTSPEATPGYARHSLAIHTEARAIRNPDLRPGEGGRGQRGRHPRAGDHPPHPEAGDVAVPSE
ncbi:hypothetical protein ACWEN3_26560 [Streptomyces sp. NPDC004561]